MSTFSVCFCAYSVFLLLDCLTEVRLSEYADFDAVNICIDVSDSVLCSSITHRWWSNTGGSDSGKGSPVNLDSSEHLISELPECTDRAEVNKTMYPIPVIGPSPFWYFEKKIKNGETRLSACTSVKVVMLRAGCVVFATAPLVRSQLSQHLLCRGGVKRAAHFGWCTGLWCLERIIKSYDALQ